jgi:hypothetical protein
MKIARTTFGRRFPLPLERIVQNRLARMRRRLEPEGKSFPPSNGAEMALIRLGVMAMTQKWPPAGIAPFPVLRMLSTIMPFLGPSRRLNCQRKGRANVTAASAGLPSRWIKAGPQPAHSTGGGATRRQDGAVRHSMDK